MDEVSFVIQEMRLRKPWSEVRLGLRRDGWIKPGLPIAKRRGSRVLPSSLASVKCSFTQASELRSEIGKVSGQKGKPTAAHLGRRSPLW